MDSLRCALALLCTGCTLISGYPDVVGEVGAELCSDGVDQDFDGLVDCQDPQCECAQVRDLALGFAHSCALSEAGHVVCWGRGTEGQLGDGLMMDEARPGGGALGVRGAVSIAAGFARTCAVLEGGDVWCWGDGSEPAAVAGIGDVRALSLGRGFACALVATGEVWCWGEGGEGQLGRGIVADGEPAPVLGIRDATMISAGLDSACAVLETGSVVCWGARSLNGTPDRPGEPVVSPDIGDAIGVDVGSFGACVWMWDGTVECWGDLFEEGAFDEVFDVIEVAIGAAHACMRFRYGSVSCRGVNADGQLGDGSFEDRGVLAAVGGVESVTGLRAGEVHNCVLRDPANQVVCWGDNEHGQLGDGGDEDRNSVAGELRFFE